MELREIEEHIPDFLTVVDREALIRRTHSASSLVAALCGQIREQFIPDTPQATLDEAEERRRSELQNFLDGVYKRRLDDELVALFGVPDEIMSVKGPEGHWIGYYEIAWHLIELPDGSAVCVYEDDPESMDGSQYRIVARFDPGTPRDEMISEVFVTQIGTGILDEDSSQVRVSLYGSTLEAALDRIAGGTADGYRGGLIARLGEPVAMPLDELVQEVADELGLDVSVVKPVVEAALQPGDLPVGESKRSLEILRTAFFASWHADLYE